MPEVIISTESGSDLPQNLIERYDFRVIPMHVIMDMQSYEDGSFPVEQVYEYYERTGKVPSTSAVNDHEYTEFWNRLREEAPGCIIFHFTYSSLASSTNQSANIAVKAFQNVFVIDTLNVSGGCTAHMVASRALITKRLDEAKHSGNAPDYAAIAEECRALAGRAVCHFVPGTLEYLRAGGRVSNAQYIGATLLNLKPLIEMVEGKLVATKKYRGSIPKLCDRFFADFLEKYRLDKSCLYLMYSKGLEEGTLKRMAEKALEFGFKSYEYVMTGCVISCHGGKGAIGLAGMLEE